LELPAWNLVGCSGEMYSRPLLVSERCIKCAEGKTLMKPIVALLATALVWGLYGAGVRRPFGSLPRIPDVPRWLWHYKRRIQIADWIFAAFITTMLIVLFFHMNFVALMLCGVLFFGAADLLSYKIRLIPSFYIAVVLALLAIALVMPLDWIISVATISAAATER
jgi:hypothetical protein